MIATALALPGCATDDSVAETYGPAMAAMADRLETVRDDGAFDLGVSAKQIDDNDGDGVASDIDCDDDHPGIGKLLHSETFADGNSGYFGHGPRLDDPWTDSQGLFSPMRGGQQVQIGADETFQNTVTYAFARAHGVEQKCDNCRWLIEEAMPDDNGGNGGHVLWLPGFYTNDNKHKVRMRMTAATAIIPSAPSLDDGGSPSQVSLAGSAYVYDLGGGTGELGDVWQLDIRFAYLGTGAEGQGTGGPKIEMQNGVQYQFTDLWEYYTVIEGTLTHADGSTVTFTQAPHSNVFPMQLGIGANNKNMNYGLSTWLFFERRDADGELITSGQGDINIDLPPRDRFRIGVMARVNTDGDQDEGVHGYRCAVARNSKIDVHPAGKFTQLATFLDVPEDDINSETCHLGENCDSTNISFEELGRVARADDDNMLDGETVFGLALWTYGDSIHCATASDKHDYDDITITSTQNSEFDSGGTGLSTLNGLADFMAIVVCEVHADIPEGWPGDFGQ